MVDDQGRPLLLEEAVHGLEVRRFLPSGQPDVSFGSGGATFIRLPVVPLGYQQEIAADGSGVVVAYTVPPSRSPAHPYPGRELLLV
jgi:hypothetical protein